MKEKEYKKLQGTLGDYEVFKVVTARHGSGWEAVHVALDWRLKVDSVPDEMLLTRDAENFAEFEAMLTELHRSLDDLRPMAKALFAKIEARKLKE